jgi:hypothetical protein
MSHPKKIENLEQYFINREIMNDTARQVAKDLRLAPFEISFEADAPAPYEQMMQFVLPAITELFSGQAQKLQQTIYQVDLSESRFRAALRAENPSLALADEILKRLLQKVVIRRLYSNGAAGV